ncbi:MAG: prolyl oligopeptidase family serine peptidase [Terracidiphilus sp.]|jgi:dipeptidyl aminopeptidase/acylaminoacyl peptidase
MPATFPHLALFFAVTAAAVPTLLAQQNPSSTDLKYQLPPEVMVKLVDAPPTPTISLSPAHAAGPRRILIQQSSSLPTIADLAEPEYRLAGLRFNPKLGAQSRTRYFISLKLQTMPAAGSHAKSVETPIVGLPAKLHVLSAEWSADGQHIALVNADPSYEAAGLTLWIVDVAKASAARVPGVRLNAVLTDPISWLTNTSLAVLTVPDHRGPVPVHTEIPTGPVVQENDGKATPAPTYEDLLKTPYDESVFEYYATSQLAEVELGGVVHKLGKPGVFARLEPSPDGKYVFAEELHRPFSYHQPYERFPQRREVFAVATGEPKVLDDAPLIDNLPIDRDAVEPGPRAFGWRADQPSTIYWVKAADGGDPKAKAKVRDQVFTVSAPFTAEAKPIADLEIRFRGIAWGNDHLAMLFQGRWKDRKTIIAALDPATGKLTQLYQGSMQDRYHDPGRPLLERNAQGFPVLQTTPAKDGVYFTGAGASPKGDTPFVAIMPVNAGENPTEKRIWQSQAPFYELATAVIESPSGVEVLARRESVEQSPNYFLTAPVSDASAPSQWTQVTNFPNPYAGIPMPSHQLLHYKRDDGVDLTADLYLPAGYDKSKGPLPTLMEAYPAEFKSRAAASQVTGSPYEFVRIGALAPGFFTLTGYAVLANAAIPIIGEGNAEPNDTYTEQLVAGAKAAIDAGAATGTVDRNRVGVMGHSYGAFMTANLLAHSNLFRAGIARSGAYNRSLTPFGFQNEERTYWQAPEVYYKMSPFSYADKIKTPILLIHGEADNNTGTFPIQSERFYDALKGEGATVRFVLLPLEAHGYQGRESVLHMLWEMENWLDKYVKPEQPVIAQN